MSKNTNLSFLTDYITADITNGRIGINNASPTVAFDVVGVAKFSSSVTATGNAATTSSLYLNNPIGNSGTAQYYADFTAGATVIGRILRGNGVSGYEANGLNIDNFSGMQIKLNTLGGSGGAFNILGGNVGIGTTTPGGFASDDLVFQLYNSGAAPSRAMIRLTNSVTGSTFNNGALLSMDGALDFYVANQEIGNLIFQTSNTDRMRITSAGKVAIGTTFTSSSLNINVAAGVADGLSLTDNTTVPAVFTYNTSTGENKIGGILSYVFPTFYSGGSERMRITSDGNVGIGTSSPVSLLSLSSDNPIISLTRNDNAATARGAINFYAVSNLKWQIGTNEISGTAGFEFNFAGTNVARISTAGAAFFSTVSANTFYGGLYAPTYNDGTTFISFYNGMVSSTSRAAVMYNSADSPTAGGMWTVQFVKWDGAYGSMTALNMEPGTQTFYVKTLYNGTWSAWVQK